MRFKLPGVKAKATDAAPPRASVDVSVVAQRFNYEWAMDPDSFDGADTYWWWAASIRVDPNEVIAEGDAGELWSIPFTTDGEDTVSFGEPQQVRQTFVPVAASDGVAASTVVNKRRQRVLAAALDKPEKPDPSTAAVRPDNERTTPMDEAVRRALATSYRLDPETATEDEVNAAVLAAATTTQNPENPETPEQPETPETPEAQVDDREPVAASTDGGIRNALGLPSSATDEQVRARIGEIEAGARAGSQAQENAIRTHRDGLVDAAVQDGRIPPSARAAWREALDARPEPETAALAALAPNRIPVRERGTSTSATADSSSLNRALAASGLTTTKKGA